jgi:hypothetical protein
MNLKWLVAGMALMSVDAACEVQVKPGEDKTLARFVGTWVAEGVHMKSPMKGSVEYAWALGKQFLKGEGRITSGDGSFAYEYTIYLRPAEKEGSYTVTWLDNMGNIINSTMTLKGSTLTMEWMEKTPIGELPARSEITLSEQGWTDKSFAKKDGQWIELGSTTFKKK